MVTSVRSAEWRSCAIDALADFTAPWEGGEYTARFVDHEGPSHTQRWRDGRLLSWCDDQRSDVDCVIRCEAAQLDALITGRVGFGERLQFDDTQHNRWSIPPTTGDLSRLGSPRHIESLNLTARISVPDLVSGPEIVTYSYVDGQPVDQSSPVENDREVIDVDIAMPMLALAYMYGDVPLREFAEIVEVHTNPMDLLLLTGLVAPPDPQPSAQACREAQRATITVLESLRSARTCLDAAGLLRDDNEEQR